MTGTQASVGATSTLDRMIGLLTARAAAVDHTEVGAVLDGIHDARRVFVTGAGRSGLVARAFANRLMHLGMSVHVVGEVTTPAIERGDALDAIEAGWQPGLAKFEALRRRHLQYPMP